MMVLSDGCNLRVASTDKVCGQTIISLHNCFEDLQDPDQGYSKEHGGSDPSMEWSPGTFRGQFEKVVVGDYYQDGKYPKTLSLLISFHGDLE